LSFVDHVSFELAVRCRGVTKTFGKGAQAVAALRGVDLDIPPGQICFVVGPSGCGKTSLISIISSLLSPDQGECTVLGRALPSMLEGARADFRAREIGFVFQTFNLLPALTAVENVAVPLIVQGHSRRHAIARAGPVLEAVGLAERGHAFPRELSGGQQQRVAIARALVHQPKLVVCDEPTSALDHETGRKVMDLMRDLTRAGRCTLIVVTHDNRIFEYADIIARMDDGRIVALEDVPT
jgi:putative ABC transport system ATP-binding protein